MTQTMTFAGLDVHARSTHAAALELAGGELKRVRFGPGGAEVNAWLAALPQPVHACYEAGPTGFALYRAAEQAGLRVDVVAPSKAPRPTQPIVPGTARRPCPSPRPTLKKRRHGCGARPSAGCGPQVSEAIVQAHAAHVVHDPDLGRDRDARGDGKTCA